VTLRAYTGAHMFSLKPLVLVLALVVIVHGNCAVSCLHSDTANERTSESNPQSAENCHQSHAPKSSQHDEDGGACSHSQVSGDRSTITAQDFKPMPATDDALVLLAPEAGRISFVAEIYDPNSYASSPPITVLRI
jgi:hypothetical protein